MRYSALVKYIDVFTQGYSAGEWIIDMKHSGKADDPISMPYVFFDHKTNAFIEEFFKSHIAQKNYQEILEKAGIKEKAFDSVNLHILDETVVCAMLTSIIKGDRYCEGLIKTSIEKGTVTRILKRLKEIDESRDSFVRQQVDMGRIVKMKLISKYPCKGLETISDENEEQHLTICEDGQVFFSNHPYGALEEPKVERHDITPTKAHYLLSTLEACFEESGVDLYTTNCGSWNIEFTNEQGEVFLFHGSLNKDLVYRKEALSKLIREFLNMPQLLLFDADVRREIRLKENEYIFVDVIFGACTKIYSYICDDPTIKEEDEVIVPVGFDHSEIIGTVEAIHICSKENSPYPIELCKHVIRRIV